MIERSEYETRETNPRSTTREKQSKVVNRPILIVERRMATALPAV
jgi:hypothetical protein